MQDAGLKPDEMLDVIKLAREKYKYMQKEKCFCGQPGKYIYEFKELNKKIHRCEKHKVNDTHN